MAQDRPQGASQVSLKGGENISLDQLISATSTSVLRALREHESQEAQGKLVYNPKIWVGIWIDLDRFGGLRNPGAVGGPGGGGLG